MENMNLQHPVVASVLNLFPVQFASCTFLEHSSVNKTIEFLKDKKNLPLVFPEKISQHPDEPAL